MKGKTIHVINISILSVFLIVLGFFTIRIFFDFFTDQYKRISLGEGLVFLLLLLLLLYIFILHIRAFRLCKLRNGWFLTSLILNLLVFFGLVIFLSSFYYYVRLSGGSDTAIGGFVFFIFIFGLIYFISMIIFLIGYYKNKKK